MTVKKFTKINLIFGVFIVSLTALISMNYWMYFSNDLYKFYKYSSSKNNSKEYVILGSSHALYGLNTENDNIMNLARSSQNFYYDLQLLKKYNLKIKNNAIIIIPISIFSFYNLDADIDSNYVNLLKKKQIKNITLEEYYLKKYFGLVYPINNILNIFKYFNNKQIVYRANIKRENLIEESKLTVEGHLKNNKVNTIEDFTNLVKYIENKKWNIVFITTPFTSIYNHNIVLKNKNAYNSRIYSNLENLIEKKYIYLDYSHDIRFQNNLKYFIDDDHLNEKGAKKFIKILFSDITAQLIVKK